MKLLIIFVILIICLVVFMFKEDILFHYKIWNWQKHAKEFNHKVKNELGYRNDCTGFISYIWGLSPKLGSEFRDGGGVRIHKGYREMHNIKNWVHEIEKNELKRGDIIILQEFHVILFYKWDNKEKTRYCGYEFANIHNARGFKYFCMKFPYDNKIRPYSYNYKLYRKK